MALASKAILLESLRCLLLANNESTRMKEKDSKLQGKMLDLFNEKLSLAGELFMQLDVKSIIFLAEFLDEST